MGELISTQRKAKGMTQAELADKMGVTDKAVSKWERDLSCPDVASLGRLAGVLGVSVEELLNSSAAERPARNRENGIWELILLGVGLAQGVAVTVLSILQPKADYLTMVGIGMCCFGLYLFRKRERGRE